MDQHTILNIVLFIVGIGLLPLALQTILVIFFACLNFIAFILETPTTNKKALNEHRQKDQTTA